MQDIDTEKLKEILEMMQATGAIYFKHGETEVAFSPEYEVTDARGTDASSSDVGSEDTEASSKVKLGFEAPKAVGYGALFKDKTPKFKAPVV